MEKWLFLVLGGSLGTLSRFFVGGAVAHKWGTSFPWGTLAVNLIGCFVIGFLDLIFEKKFLLVHNTRIFLMTGFCGAFTTLSAVMLEMSDLLGAGRQAAAIGYLFLTVGAGFAVFRLGAAVAKIL